MIKKVLQTKAWAIFVIIFGLPILLEMIFSPFSPTSLSKIIIPIISVLMCSGLFFWIYSISIGLHEILPSNLRLKVKKFKTIFTTTLTLFILISIVMSLSIPSINDYSELFILLIFIIMLGLLYSIYFTAKTFKTCELQRNVGFSDFAGEFFLIWFFPVGIFIIQPKVNMLITK